MLPYKEPETRRIWIHGVLNELEAILQRKSSSGRSGKPHMPERSFSSYLQGDYWGPNLGDRDCKCQLWIVQNSTSTDSPALFSRTRLSSESGTQELRRGHVWVKICFEDCVWEKWLASAFSPSVSPLSKKRSTLLPGTSWSQIRLYKGLWSSHIQDTVERYLIYHTDGSWGWSSAQ